MIAVHPALAQWPEGYHLNARQSRGKRVLSHGRVLCWTWTGRDDGVWRPPSTVGAGKVMTVLLFDTVPLDVGGLAADHGLLKRTDVAP